MALQVFNNGDSAVTTRTKLNALVAAVNGLSPVAMEHAITLWPAWAGCAWNTAGPVGASSNASPWITLDYVTGGGRTAYTAHAPNDTDVYTVVGAVKFNLPAAFNQWSQTANPLSLDLFTTDASADCSVDVNVYRGTTLRASLTEQSSANAWGSLVFTNEVIGDDWAAGDEVTVEVTLRARGSKVSKVGKLSLGLLLADAGGKVAFVYGLSGYGGSGGYGA